MIKTNRVNDSSITCNQNSNSGIFPYSMTMDDKPQIMGFHQSSVVIKLRSNLIHAPHPWFQYFGHADRAISLLVSFHHCDQGSRQTKPRTIQGVHVLSLA